MVFYWVRSAYTGKETGNLSDLLAALSDVLATILFDRFKKKKKKKKHRERERERECVHARVHACVFSTGNRTGSLLAEL